MILISIKSKICLRFMIDFCFLFNFIKSVTFYAKPKVHNAAHEKKTRRNSQKRLLELMIFKIEEAMKGHAHE